MATATNLGTIYTAGLNNVGTYQVSGVPYATASFDSESGLQINFPYVTRWIVVSYSGSTASRPDLRIGFSEHGVVGTENNYFYNLKPNTTSPRFELKLSQLWLYGGEAQGVSVMAGLTNLSTDRVDNASTSGANWSGSVGVG